MTETSGVDPSKHQQMNPRHDQVICVTTDSPVSMAASNESLWNILQAIWAKKLLLAVSVLAAMILGATYAFLATPWYRTEVLLAVTEDTTTPILAGQLGSLASIAGISVGTANSTAEVLATLESREFARSFIEDVGLLTVFFSNDWDSELKSWKVTDPSKIPDTRDAVKFFHERVLQVTQNRQTGLVTLRISWIDPTVSVEWANELVRRLNERMRSRALNTAEANVRFLQHEMATTSLVELRQSIGRLLETEMQKLMLARGNDEYAVRVVDPPQRPKEPSHPNRSLTILLSGILGGVLGSTLILFRRILSERNPSAVD